MEKRKGLRIDFQDILIFGGGGCEIKLVKQIEKEQYDVRVKLSTVDWKLQEEIF